MSSSSSAEMGRRSVAVGVKGLCCWLRVARWLRQRQGGMCCHTPAWLSVAGGVWCVAVRLDGRSVLLVVEWQGAHLPGVAAVWDTTVGDVSRMVGVLVALCAGCNAWLRA